MHTPENLTFTDSAQAAKFLNHLQDAVRTRNGLDPEGMARRFHLYHFEDFVIHKGRLCMVKHDGNYAQIAGLTDIYLEVFDEDAKIFRQTRITRIIDTELKLVYGGYVAP